jgi:hypothetical protein
MRLFGSLSFALIVAACTTTYEQHEPFVEVVVEDTESTDGTPTITLADARYDTTPQFSSFILENTGADVLFITPAPPVGIGSDLLIFEIPSYTVLLPGQKMPVETSLDTRTWRWETGAYSPTLKIEARYFFAGQSPDQPEDPSTTAAPSPVAAILDLQVNFNINCDIDGDGFDSIECGCDYFLNALGEVQCGAADCDDRIPDIYPGAPETCDGTDQDCDGARDEDAIDQLTWYYDSDRDGYGTPEQTTQACARPGLYWVDNDEDCDDENIVNSPSGTELCDGIDNNCNDEIDEGC